MGYRGRGWRNPPGSLLHTIIFHLLLGVDPVCMVVLAVYHMAGHRIAQNVAHMLHIKALVSHNTMLVLPTFLEPESPGYYVMYSFLRSYIRQSSDFEPPVP